MKIKAKIVSGIIGAGLIFTSGIMAQSNVLIKGTIGREKAQGDRITICVFGTQACMPVRVDTTQRINVGISLRKLNELPIGLYVEAKINKALNGLSTIETLKVDENKTVFCFNSLSADESARVRKLLLSTNGVKRAEVIESSRQVLVIFDSQIISYQSLENILRNGGFALE